MRDPKLGRFVKRDLTGNVYGRLTVVQESRKRDSSGGIYWVCKCTCGRSTEVVGYTLTRGDAKSCGCLAREIASMRATTHGMKGTTEYNIWSSIKQRCLNTNNKDYPRYGGRGIKICERWLNSFENFYEDMGERPSLKHSIDRIDNDGDYTPENCRWATRSTQQSNKRNNRKLTLRARTMTQSMWARRTGIAVDTIHRRLERGWTVEEALTIPVGAKR